MKKRVFFISFAVLAIDFYIKQIILENLKLNGLKLVFDNFFYITNVRNYGAAWGILENSNIFLILAAVVAIVLVIKFFVLKKDNANYEYIINGLLLGGIAGNLFDRIFRGYVVDYLKFNIFGYHFPIFNFADILIVISAFYLIVKMLKEDSNE